MGDGRGPPRPRAQPAGALVAAAVWVGAASAATGSLEICKAGDNGAGGQVFTFTYAKGTGTPASVSVTGGQCSAPIPVPAGNYLVQEDLTSGRWAMIGASVTPAGNWVSENDKAGKVKVAVGGGISGSPRWTGPSAASARSMGSVARASC